ncbi:MAG: hypothetical protein ACFFG0_49550 [Candidatus Thorarchaeota archaeon]
MIENEDEIWDLLKKFNVNKLSFTYDKKGKLMTKVGSINRFMFSYTYTKFIEHINRVMIIYPKIIEKKSTTEIPERIEQYLYRSNFLILLINSLETYLDMVFRWSTKFLFIRDLNKKNFIKFIKSFRIRDNFFDKLIEKDNLNIVLTDILSERMDFQNKDKCKVAYNLINIDLPGLYEDFWHNIFDNEPTSYMQTRHRIIHDVMPDIKNIDSECSIDFVERALLDIVNYVFFIEEKRLELYPDSIEVEFFKALETELLKPEDQRKSFGELINEVADKLNIEKIKDFNNFR